MNNKIEELLSAVKLNDLISRKQIEEKKKNKALCVIAIITAVAAIAAVVYAIYKRCTPDYLEDFDEDFDDDYEDDFENETFEVDEDSVEVTVEEAENFEESEEE